MSISELSFDEAVQRLRAGPGASAPYLAMYSAWLGGFTRDPALMLIPVDDHIVHRGDGVFEAIKCLDGRIYALDAHLERLGESAAMIGMKLARPLGEIRQICIELTRQAGEVDVILRLFNSRGPGGFTANPYECPAPQLYLVITPFKPQAEERYVKGVSAKLSAMPIKEGFFPRLKSCNYLPNVLMKKEAVDGGVDFVISSDESGRLAEGSTENFGIVTADGHLVLPSFERTLKGVTATRAMVHAVGLAKNGLLREVRSGSIKMEDLARAREAMVFGTTIDCLPITRFEGRPLGDGLVGPVAKFLRQALRAEMAGSGPLVTKV